MALSRGLRCCARVFSWIPVLIITSVVLWSYYAYVFELCVFTISNTLEKVAYLLVFHVCFVMFSWTYWKAIFTPPATPCKKFQLSYSDKDRYEREERPDAQKQILVDIAKSLPIFTRATSGAIRFCDRCQVLKPDRSHHCSVCETCVLKMDHHCPWVNNCLSLSPGVNNCVGFSNYKFFLLFLSYSMVYCVFISASVFRFFINFWVGDLPNGPAKFHVLFLMFVALMFLVSLMFLLGYHCWLVVQNRSTLEAFSAPVFTTGPDRNGFNVGIRRNLQQVFGDNKRLWFLPICTRDTLLKVYTPTLFLERDPPEGLYSNPVLRDTLLKVYTPTLFLERDPPGGLHSNPVPGEKPSWRFILQPCSWRETLL
ncbi:palmitoyltransferase ZDHHC15B isoform X11 [Oncorhynchus keta]|uniref:palmitoyltransferase ZDHHC15B isoform X11 n=1 Tax=Oncorhynchus keta TaxID=8018 RepID=UPI00227B8878|nr:palmitoyltransferase ZDHHC15B isoform X11 [Oncorhynchus keta]